MSRKIRLAGRTRRKKKGKQVSRKNKKRNERGELSQQKQRKSKLFFWQKNGKRAEKQRNRRKETCERNESLRIKRNGSCKTTDASNSKQKQAMAGRGADRTHLHKAEEHSIQTQNKGRTGKAGKRIVKPNGHNTHPAYPAQKSWKMKNPEKFIS